MLRRNPLMKTHSLVAFGILAISTANSMAQVDIYQSDAYSVEEMCARQAAQEGTGNYDAAYEQCINNNVDKPMYQSGARPTKAGLASKGNAEESTRRNNY